MPDPLKFNPAAPKMATTSIVAVEEPPLPETSEQPEQDIEIPAPYDPELLPTLEPKKSNSKTAKGNWRTAKPAATANVETRRQPGEGFFEYQQRISPNDWDSGRIWGNYVYKILPGGKRKRIGDEPMRRPITLQDLREIANDQGPGTYLVQFQHSLAHLTPCAETLTFDEEGKSTAGGTGFKSSDPEGTAYTMKVASDITKDAASAAVAMMKENQIQNNRAPDMGAMMTGLAAVIAAVQPKPVGEDKTLTIMMTMLQNQAAEAVRRADAAEKRAEDQRRQDKEDADRREKQWREEADRREQRMKDDATASAARDQKFFEIMLKDKEKKSDEFGLTDMLKGIVVPLLQERIEGGGAKEGWTGVAENIIDKAPDMMNAVASMFAAKNGASPGQVQAMTVANPAPQTPAQPTLEDEFSELMLRIGKYLSRDIGLCEVSYLAGMPEEMEDEENEGADRIPGMIEIEYPGIFTSLFVGQPKDVIVQAISGTQIGKAILDNPYGGPFLHKVVDSIKAQMVPPVEPEQEIAKEGPILVDPQGQAVNPKQKKVNGAAKAKAEVQS